MMNVTPRERQAFIRILPMLESRPTILYWDEWRCIVSATGPLDAVAQVRTLCDNAGHSRPRDCAWTTTTTTVEADEKIVALEPIKRVRTKTDDQGKKWHVYQAVAAPNKMESAVTKRRNWRLSPTRIRAREECERKWYLSEVLGLSEGAKPAAHKGTRIHFDAEMWVKKRRDPRTPEVFWAEKLGLLPDRDHPGIRCEVPIDEAGLELAGVPLDGLIDVLLPPLRPGDPVRIWDYKTRGSFSYAPTSAELREDPQAVLYPLAAMEITGADTAVFGHLNLLRIPDGPDCGVTVVEWDREALEAQRKILEHGAWEMVETAKKSVDETEPNFRACYRYGKCGFYDICRGLEPVRPQAGETSNTDTKERT